MQVTPVYGFISRFIELLFVDKSQSNFFTSNKNTGISSDSYGTTRESVLTLSSLTSADFAKYKCLATYTNIGTLTSAEKQVVVTG